MRLKMIAIVTVLFASFVADNANAADWEKFWSRFHLVKQRNNAWPQPFLLHDQQTYHGMINPQINQGWAVEATMAGHHFDAETNELNRAGKAKLASILRNVPTDKQTVYVVNDKTPEIALARMESIQQTLSGWTLDRDMKVTTTEVRPSPQTGVFVETSYKEFHTALPKPGLSNANVGSIGGGGN